MNKETKKAISDDVYQIHCKLADLIIPVMDRIFELSGKYYEEGHKGYSDDMDELLRIASELDIYIDDLRYHMLETNQ